MRASHGGHAIPRHLAALILTVLSAAALPPAALTAEWDPAPFETRIVTGPTLADLTAYAAGVNPAVRAAREAWRRTVEKYRAETVLPDPQLTATYWPESFPDDFGVSKLEAMFSQTLPWPGMLGAAGRVVEAQARRARFELDRATVDVSVNIRQSFHELAYIREASRIALRNRELLDNLRKAGESAYTGNRAALADVLRAQSQTAQVEYDILLLAELERAETIRLNSLLDRRVDASVGPLAEEPLQAVSFALEEVLRFAETGRPEILMAAAEEAMALADVEMARYLNRPEFMTGLLYEYNAPQGDVKASNMVGFQVGLSLPLWPGKRAGRVGAATAGVEKARADTSVMVNETRSMVGETWFRLQNAWRLVVLYRDQLVPQAAKAMELAQVRNREGEGSFSDYVETQAVWYNFQLALARARADYGKYLAALEGLTGRNLTSRGKP